MGLNGAGACWVPLERRKTRQLTRVVPVWRCLQVDPETGEANPEEPFWHGIVYAVLVAFVPFLGKVLESFSSRLLLDVGIQFRIAACTPAFPCCRPPLSQAAVVAWLIPAKCCFPAMFG